MGTSDGCSISDAGLGDVQPIPLGLDQALQFAHGEGAQFHEVVLHSRQGRCEHRRLGGVVESDDRQILRDTQAEFVGHAQRAKRHLVVAGEDGIQMGIGFE